jgi:hypothetical protein
MNQYTAQIIPAGPAAVRVLVLRNGATRLDKTLKGPVPSAAEAAKKVVSAELGSIPIKWKQISWGHYTGSASGTESGGVHGTSRKNPKVPNSPFITFPSRSMAQAFASAAKAAGHGTVMVTKHKDKVGVLLGNMSHKEAEGLRNKLMKMNLKENPEGDWRYKAITVVNKPSFGGKLNKAYVLKWGKVQQPDQMPKTHAEFVSAAYAARGARYSYPKYIFNFGEVYDSVRKLPAPLAEVTAEDYDNLMKKFDEDDRKENPYMSNRQILTQVRKGELDKLSYSQLQIAALSLLAHSPMQKTVQAEMKTRPEYTKLTRNPSFQSDPATQLIDLLKPTGIDVGSFDSASNRMIRQFFKHFPEGSDRASVKEIAQLIEATWVANDKKRDVASIGEALQYALPFPPLPAGWAGLKYHVAHGHEKDKHGRPLYYPARAQQILDASKLTKNPYLGFKKLTKSLAAKGSKGIKDAKTLAASIGRKKYGKKAFQAMAKTAKAIKAEVTKVAKGKKNPVSKGLTATLVAKKELWLFAGGNDQTHVVIKPGEKVKVSYSPGIRYATAYKQHWSGKMTSASIEEGDLRESFKVIPDSWNVPKENPSKLKNNPNNEAAQMYSKFHGKPSTSILEFKEREHVHSHLSQLGTLSELKVVLNPLDSQSKQRLVTLAASGGAAAHDDSKAVHLCSSEDGTSLYLVGGDQALDLKALGMFASADIKDLMVIGVIDEVTYRTQKNFDKFKTLDYFHGLGEVTGKQPMLLYKPRDKKMLIAGGQYLVKREGITN